MAGYFLRIELALNDDLSGNASMVGSRNPQSVFARHAGMTHQTIHDGLIKCVTHMQSAGDIGRRQLNAEVRFIVIKGGTCNAALFPFRTPKCFDWSGFV